MPKINQKGIAAALIVIILAALIAGGLAWYFVSSQKTNENTNQATNTVPKTNSASNANVAVDTSDWQVFTNNNYHYQLSYPADWYYIESAMSGPPAPATAFFSSQPAESSVNYASLNILVSDLMNETLDTWGEISSLVADGYEKTDLVVSGQPAVRLERNTHEMDSGATIYVAKNNYMYRLVWGATYPDTYVPYEQICEAMAQSFAFIKPVAADFTQSGTLARPAESQSYYILWEQPGNPAVNKELVFDAKGFISTCILSDESRGRCTDLITNGLLNVGDSITVEGILDEDGKVDVITITVL